MTVREVSDDPEFNFRSTQSKKTSVIRINHKLAVRQLVKSILM